MSDRKRGEESGGSECVSAWEITFELWQKWKRNPPPKVMCSKWAKRRPSEIQVGRLAKFWQKVGGVAITNITTRTAAIYATNRALKIGQTRRGQPQDLKLEKIELGSWALGTRNWELETDKSLCEKQTINLFCSAKGTPGPQDSGHQDTGHQREDKQFRACWQRKFTCQRQLGPPTLAKEAWYGSVEMVKHFTLFV